MSINNLCGFRKLEKKTSKSSVKWWLRSRLNLSKSSTNVGQSNGVGFIKS